MKSGLCFSACDFSLQTSCWFQNCRLWRIASFVRANALFEELPPGLRASASAARKCLRAVLCHPRRSSSSPTAAG
jgi:hypothetical protein